MCSSVLPTKFPDKLGIMQGIFSSEDLGICGLCQANLQLFRHYADHGGQQVCVTLYKGRKIVYIGLPFA